MIRTRFAPSPTGDLHIGGLRTALYSYLLAKNKDGKFVLRIEDTDKKREISGSKERIKEILKDFGLAWDEYYVQSERVKTGIYKKVALKLIKDGHAFYCKCEAKNAKKGYSTQLRDPCREKKLTAGCVKLKVPEDEVVTYKDFVLNKVISWRTAEVFDATLLKSNGYPTYHLAVVVDDSDMKITHALRGYAWLPSTPIHLLVYKFLHLLEPKIGHLTDILDPEGGKLSKRKGSVSVDVFIKEGYLPEALLNFVLLLGWAPKNDQEIFSLDEMTRVFSAKGFQKSNPIFDRTKLLWMNGEYIRKTDDSELVSLVYDFYKGKYPKDKLNKIIPLVKDRIKKLSDIESIAGFLLKEKAPKPLKITSQHSTHISQATISRLEKIEDWNLVNINKAFDTQIKESGAKVGDFYMDLRGAIAGSKVTPPINESVEILGKSETIKRLKKAIK